MRSVIAVVLIIIGVVTASGGIFVMSRGGMLLWLVGLALLGLARLLVGRGRGLFGPRVYDVLADVEETPILLLRAFTDDKLSTKLRGIDLGGGEDTFEELVARAFQDFGRLIAVGRPRELLPPPGASRESYSDVVWRDRVRELLERSRLVVMIIGNVTTASSGLRWEIEQLTDFEAPEKIVLVLPPKGTEAELSTRWNAYSELFGKRVPRYQGGELLATFGHDWTCNVTRLVLGNRAAAEYEPALRAVAEHLGLQRIARPAHWFRWVALGVASAVGGLASAGIALLVIAPIAIDDAMNIRPGAWLFIAVVGIVASVLTAKFGAEIKRV